MKLSKLYLIASILALCTTAEAQVILPADIACHCILGEARGEYRTEGYKAFLAVAEVLRRRVSTQGVYGCKASLAKELPYLRAVGLDKEALRAWNESKHTNITLGATHWESTDFKEPYWAKGMIKTVKIGKHQFYREE